MAMARITSQSRPRLAPALTTALNKKNLPMNPASGGMPPSDNRKISRHRDKPGARRLKPAKFLIASPPVASSTTVTTPNAPTVVSA